MCCGDCRRSPRSSRATFRLARSPRVQSILMASRRCAATSAANLFVTRAYPGGEVQRQPHVQCRGSLVASTTADRSTSKQTARRYRPTASPRARQRPRSPTRRPVPRASSRGAGAATTAAARSRAAAESSSLPPNLSSWAAQIPLLCGLVRGASSRGDDGALHHAQAAGRSKRALIACSSRSGIASRADESTTTPSRSRCPRTSAPRSPIWTKATACGSSPSRSSSRSNERPTTAPCRVSKRTDGLHVAGCRPKADQEYDADTAGARPSPTHCAPSSRAHAASPMRTAMSAASACHQSRNRPRWCPSHTSASRRSKILVVGATLRTGSTARRAGSPVALRSVEAIRYVLFIWWCASCSPRSVQGSATGCTTRSAQRPPPRRAGGTDNRRRHPVRTSAQRRCRCTSATR